MSVMCRPGYISPTSWLASRGKPYKEKLFFSSFDYALDPFACFGRQALLRQTRVFLFAPARNGTQKSDLLSIAAAPFAEQKMDAQSNPLAPGKSVVQRVGLQAGDFPAPGREVAHRLCEGFQQVGEPIHFS